MIEYENLKLLNESLFQAYEEKFHSFIQSGWYILGEQVKEFEENFSRYIGTNHCKGVASGLDALTLSLISLDLPDNGEVIIAGNSYISSVLSVLNARLTPILVEQYIETYNISVDGSKKAITKNTVAIHPVHM